MPTFGRGHRVDYLVGLHACHDGKVVEHQKSGVIH